ncbi:hypothetical protein F5B22DRAFT_139638 [Xylaria bambusicola]|uniref:uncharacterized protein n=1 Tax=Xylaria bambusicola TaxID=326684 RepID=UPI0020078DB8|nr:uncharacterized protein F5B22DRAFT_139638 [Xylaria bambusicola]KAI0516974.1 hypothetical protein F5B22DRAFT_139638 [Xylaria bambusicola]
MLRTKMKAFLAKLHRPGGSRAPVQDRDARDVFAGLPFELHVLIIDYLEPRDIDAALNASRVLRLIWLSDEMWPALADRWFPGLAQQIRLADLDESVRSEVFRRSLHRLSKRIAGKFNAAMHYGFGLASDEFFHFSKNVPVNEGGVHSYDSVENLEIDDAQRFSRFLMYRDGRVAWFPEGYSMPYLAVVDDLRSRTRKVYLFPDYGESIRGYKTAMSQKLFMMGHNTMLHVWHLELNRMESIELPENFQRCITEGERVLVVCQSSDLYLWTFGGKLVYVDMNKLSCYPREFVVLGGPPVWTPRIWLSSQQGLHLRNSQLLIDFILSPALSNVFFAITLALDESGKLAVYEICDGEIAATYVMKERIYSDPRTSERGLLRWEKLNSYGGYCLVQVIQEPLTAIDAADEEVCPCGRKSRQLVSLCFNIYTKTFTVLRHHLSELSPWISHVWNDRLFIMDDQFHRRQAGLNRRPVMSLAPCIEADTRRETANPIVMYTTMHENTPLIYRRHQVSFDAGEMGEKLNIELGLDVLQEFSPSPTWKEAFIPSPSEINPGRLVGDDDFFIFVNSPSYTLLSFGEGFPPKQPLANETKYWWRKSRVKDGTK